MFISMDIFAISAKVFLNVNNVSIIWVWKWKYFEMKYTIAAHSFKDNVLWRHIMKKNFPKVVFFVLHKMCCNIRFFSMYTKVECAFLYIPMELYSQAPRIATLKNASLSSVFVYATAFGTRLPQPFVSTFSGSCSLLIKHCPSLSTTTPNCAFSLCGINYANHTNHVGARRATSAHPREGCGSTAELIVI